MKSNLQGWLIVLGGFVGLSLSFSARSTLGLVMPVWTIEFGWSREFISAGGATALVVMAMIAPLVGNLVDRYGARVLLSTGLGAVGLGMLLTAFVEFRWQFLLAFGLIAAVGFGVVATHVAATAVAPYFSRNRGLATGIVTAGSTAGQLLVIPLVAALMGTMSWRFVFQAIGVVGLVLAPVVWLLVKRRPSSPPHAAAQTPPEGLNRRLAFLIGHPAFHALFWSFAICGFTTAGVIETHFMPYAEASGFLPVTSATAYGMLAAFNMCGMVAAGFLADRMHRPLLLAMIYLLRGLSFALLLYIAWDVRLLFLFAAVFGLFDYSTVPVTANLVVSHLGLRIMGLAMGVLSAGHSLGAAAGAYFGGYIFDRMGSYDGVWVISLVLSLVAGLIVLTLREQKEPTMSASDLAEAEAS